MKLRISAQNLQGGGLVGFGGQQRDRLGLLAERLLDGGRPHIALLTDAQGWHEGDALHRFAESVGLKPGQLTIAPRPGLHTVALYDPDAAELVQYHDGQSDWIYHGAAVYGFDVGLTQLLACIPTHLSAYSPTHARMEAEYLSTIAYRCGQLGIIAGDINYSPWHPDNPPPHTDTWHAYNRKSGALPPADPRADPALGDEPNREIARVFARAGMADVAWWLYEQGNRSDPELLRRTAHDDRIDQAFVTAPLAHAIEGYRVLDLHGQEAFEVGGQAASDHHGLTFLLDTDRVDQRNLTPWR